MARKENPIIVESVEFDYVGTDEQFNTFLKSIIKDYLTENNLLPDYYDDKINSKKVSIRAGYYKNFVICCGCTEVV